MGTPFLILMIPLIGIVFGCILGGCALYFDHRRKTLWHETARLALEKGQPLPAIPETNVDQKPGKTDASGKRDIRSGMILLGVGSGLYFAHIGGDKAIWAIPTFIGIALLLYGGFIACFSKDQSTP